MRIGDYDVLVDDDLDYAKFNQYNWWTYKHRNTRYARGENKGSRETILLHNLVNPPPEGYINDHKNGNGLDNRKENLRLATRGQNRANSATKREFKGVYKSGNRFKAIIVKDKKQHYLGTFETAKDAALAYNKAAIQKHGEFARVNITL
jgi:hypothetical protein